jgi:DNA-binding transcriptional ArsR family regulator
MDQTGTIVALGALAQPTRLKAFRLLLKVCPDRIAAGDIARACKVPHNTMSAHLAILSRAGLITWRREGRTMFYGADVQRFRSLVRFLMHDCCSGRAELCAPLVAELDCCAPVRKREKARA